MKNQPTVNVIDAICGAGKTSFAIQMMNETAETGFGIVSEKKERYLFVTPFKKEIERIIDSTNFEIHTPSDERTTKLNDARRLIEDGKSVAMTHELFSRFDEEILSDIEMQGYILIMDEVANVIQQVDANPYDINNLIKLNAIEIDGKGKVSWLDEDYPTRDAWAVEIRLHAEKENLYYCNNTAVFWTMDVKSFTAFKEVYILTYLFNGQIQRYYYDLHNLDYTKKSVTNINGKYELVEYDNTLEPRAYIKSLLNIFEDIVPEGKARKSELNTNYNHDRKKNPNYWLSSSWFSKASDEEINQLRKNLNTYFTTQAPTTTDKVFWTTKKDMGLKLKSPKTKFDKKRNNPKKDDVYKDNFLSFNVRATNDYADRTAMAFVFNRFMNPIEKKFFESRGVKIDEDMLAVSDLVQFLFRGCIRNDEEMSCYIPSPRMRNLLYDWMEFKI